MYKIHTTKILDTLKVDISNYQLKIGLYST